MLWYKTWLETRSRFLISLCGILAICSYAVLHGNSQAASHSLSNTWCYFVLQQAHMRLAMLWPLAVCMLMMGGLLRESAVGASDFTLALPVSRARLMLARIGMGYLEAIALALLPWLAMFLLACSTGNANSLENAAFHLLLLTAGGSVFVAWALLISTLVSGEYTAPAVCLGVVLIVVITLGDPPLSAWSPWSLLTGDGYLNPRTGLRSAPVPWLRLGITMLVAMVLTGASVKAVQAREF
jgi:ABC-2 type transport system permease protein